jgi:hypothetical protein
MYIIKLPIALFHSNTILTIFLGAISSNTIFTIFLGGIDFDII